MIHLTKEEILVFHQQLIDRYGGLPGIRDEGLLDSALNMPFQGFGETDFYPTIPEKAVRLCFGLVKITRSSMEISESERWHSQCCWT